MAVISGVAPAPPGRARAESRPPAARPFDPARAASYAAVIGCDEVGRGALCGPVVVAAVWFEPAAIPPDLLARLDDSKRVPEAERDRLAVLIRHHARFALAAGSRAAIDRDNIREATLAAMTRAVRRLGRDLGHRAPVRVDGRDVPPGLALGSDVVLPCEAVIGGDARVPQIAAASILAKTVRDGLMRRLAPRHPAYCWERNVGYGTAAHRRALGTLGATAHHRRSFLGRVLPEAVSSG